MKFPAFVSALIAMVLFSGCISASSLDRKPEKKAPPKKVVQKPKKRNNQDEDPLFNAIFHRNPQKMEDDSRLSEKEKELFRRNNMSNDADLNRIRKDEMKNRQQGADWVFGTKNGSYF